MAQGITFDIKARVTGYENSLNQLKKEFEKIDPGSSIGKKLTKAIESAEARLKGLNKNLTPKATSDTQIDNIIEKTNAAGDAIQNIIKLMNSVTGKDLNISSLGDEIQQVINKIDALESEVESGLNKGFVNFLSGSTDEAKKLQQIFSDLGFKIEDISNKNALNILTKGLKEAQAEADKAADALEQINRKLEEQQNAYKNKFGNNPFANENFNETDFATRMASIKMPSQVLDTQKIEVIKQQMLEGLSNLNLDDRSELVINLLDNLFRDLTPENIRQKLNTFTNIINQEFNVSKSNIKAQLLNGKTDTQFINALLGIDEQQLETAKISLTKQLEEIADGLKPEQIANIKTLIDKDQIEDAKNATLNAMRQAYEAIKRQMQEENKQIENLVKEQQEAKIINENANKRLTATTEGKNIYDEQIRTLTSTVTRQEEEIKTLKQQLESLLDTNAKGLAGEGTGIDPRIYQISAEEAQKYHEQLDQVRAKEQLVGKIEGLVQRWFSIYAAVRMANNAIRSVISTVKELDKTITEIAIVTDMTQDDLWNQMSSYTEMARQYAASISGVYQVSQLYYQIR